MYIKFRKHFSLKYDQNISHGKHEKSMATLDLSYDLFSNETIPSTILIG